jgi:DNA-binding HxlR family transcriptional regulator
MRWNRLEDEACSVARTVSVIGDRWTLLILRDCFLRVRRFEEFQARLGVTRPILASRLRKLVKDFVLAKVPYQERPLPHRHDHRALGRRPYGWQEGPPAAAPARELRQDVRPGDDLLGVRRAAQPQAGPRSSRAGRGERAPHARRRAGWRKKTTASG